jgi:hypothetical protein
MIMGMVILMAMFVLALSIALGTVHKDTSFGLEIVLGSLSSLCGAFAQWAFSRRSSDE